MIKPTKPNPIAKAPDKFCEYCGAQLKRTLYYTLDPQYLRYYINRPLTIKKYEQKRFCDGACSSKHLARRLEPGAVNYAGFV